MSLQAKSTSNLYLIKFNNIMILHPAVLRIETPLVPLYYHKVMHSKISLP